MQCFSSYGALPNIDLLCFYGFVLENNPYDTIPVELEIPESPAKVALMERYNIENESMVVETMISTLESLSGTEEDEQERPSSSWDVLLATKFKLSQAKIFKKLNSQLQEHNR
ncbi:hypothetical protein SELMODRAFT_420274 [Selaginella moellendorffii]|uniref:Rubisco LSMT substrate-binding domain-containing protein n=1 Tax=Selaginella moellendorffii TaxID=88036 RepID=D8SBH0_SELML|nr:hypothetical protein SELMODRAFT_420274 [Selaginella moellendorffii]